MKRARVFQPFYRSPLARSRGQAGVGLGLAVVHRIVEVFGGTIRVESEPGMGTRFEITLPETAAPADDGAPERREPATSPGLRHAHTS